MIVGYELYHMPHRALFYCDYSVVWGNDARQKFIFEKRRKKFSDRFLESCQRFSYFYNQIRSRKRHWCLSHLASSSWFFTIIRFVSTLDKYAFLAWREINTRCLMAIKNLKVLYSNMSTNILYTVLTHVTYTENTFVKLELYYGTSTVHQSLLYLYSPYLYKQAVSLQTIAMFISWFSIQPC